MDKNTLWHNEARGKAVVAALVKNNFTAYYAPSAEIAIAHILEEISSGASIGIGGSMTVEELGIEQRLAKRGHTIYNHNHAGLGKEESLALRRKELLSDVFLTSANAITLDGQLVNTDGSGNRVAAMLFGPKKVIVVAGVNKIVADTAAAKSRIEQYAAPINAKRLARQTPCVATGKCMDCTSPDRICAATVVIHKKPLSIEFHVVIIGEVCGY